MSEQATKTEPRPAPPGWVMQNNIDTFSGHAGPYYFREEGERTGVGFFAAPHHANALGVIHGGALLTLADMSLWDTCRREIGVFRGVTVSLNAEFVGPGPVGEFIEATGEIVRLGRKLMFARGLVTVKGETLLAFSGTLKRLS